MPAWDDVVQWAGRTPAIVNKLTGGYPRLPRCSSNELTPEELRWASFEAVIYPPDIHSEFLAFWRESGEGISSRHAEYVLSLLEQMTYREKGKDSPSPASVSFLPGAAKLECGEEAKRHIRSFIAELMTNEKSPNVMSHDVFLFPSGISAIYAVSRALKTTNLNRSQSVVVYG
ncbi:cystathionine beta-lyase [Penicillium manginii]|uniref:cystathionine beta-lyase n=1 Tax=Penicillium manginii TaxID=203109 RepID=UPI002549B6EA|nr:cystathionine beta-lyase [Penicillium manginii]KAJ5763919.1 cystathionine beta-lyase [Penicillium manginii]